MKVEEVLAKCDEFGDCMLWTGADNGKGVPKLRINGNMRSLRRWMYEQHKGVQLNASQLVTVACGHERCLAEGCLELTTKAKAAQIAWQRPDVKIKHSKAAFDAVMRGRDGGDPRFLPTIDKKIAKEIRDSRESVKDIAKRLGRSKELIRVVRNGTAWRDYSDPFAQLRR